MHYCPDCGYEYEKSIIHCPDCDVEIIDIRIEKCTVCHEKTDQLATFCTHCGNFINPDRKKQFFLRKEDEVDEVVGSCIICGVWIYPETGRQEGHKWLCLDDSHFQVYEDWANIHTTSLEYQAHIIKAQLESAGIPVTIYNQKDSSYVTTHGDLSIIKILVPKDFTDDAEDVLTDLDLN